MRSASDLHERKESANDPESDPRQRSPSRSSSRSAALLGGSSPDSPRTKPSPRPPAALPPPGGPHRLLARRHGGPRRASSRRGSGRTRSDAKSLALLGLALPAASRARPATRLLHQVAEGVLDEASRARARRPAGDERPRLARPRPPPVSAMPSARREGRRRLSPTSAAATTASSATRSSSSAATGRRSPCSTGWPRSSRASPPTPGSPTRASCWGAREARSEAMKLARRCSPRPPRTVRVDARRSSASSTSRSGSSTRPRGYTSSALEAPSRLCLRARARSPRSRPRAGDYRRARSSFSQRRRHDPAAAVRRPASATSTTSPAHGKLARRQYDLDGRHPPALRGERRAKPISRRRVFYLDHGSGLRSARARAEARLPRPSRSTAETMPRLGARAERPLRGGAALLEAGASARDAGCVSLLPPRHDRALPRQPAGARAVVLRRALEHEPALLPPLDARRDALSRKARAMRKPRALAVAAALRCSSRPRHRRTRSGTSRSTTSRASSPPATGLPPLRPRHGGDPDLPGEGRASRARASGLRRPRSPPARRGLTLTVGGDRRRAEGARHALRVPEGVGGLDTTRLEIVFDAGRVRRGRAGRACLRRTANFPDRLGWREIVVARDRRCGRRLVDRAVDERHRRAARLPAGPARRARSTSRARSAGITPGAEPGPPPRSRRQASSRAGARRVGRPRAASRRSIAKENLEVGVILVSLLAAMFWGAAHALTPGPRQGDRRRVPRRNPRHRHGTRFYLGGIVTVTHTIGVFALGRVTLALSEFIVPETLYPWLNLVSALLVVVVGITVLRLRVLDWVRPSRRSHGDEHGHHDHARPRPRPPARR